jgi:hypothetical protein
VTDLGILYRALRPWLRGYAQLGQRIDRLRSAVGLFAEGLVLTGLDADEQTDLTISIYDHADQRKETLFPWELPWFDAALPRPPARVLVGGAGLGREVLALRGLGYDVDAFEPAPHSLPQLRAAVAAGTALTGSYADFVRAHQGEPSSLSTLAAQRYDAILLGWTSLSHLPEVAEHHALFEACDAACPHGPILASFFYSSEASVPRGGRARAWGTRIGRVVAKARGIERAAAACSSNHFLMHAGVVHVFDREELDALAHTVDRVLELEPLPYAHATWQAAAR